MSSLVASVAVSSQPGNSCSFKRSRIAESTHV